MIVFVSNLISVESLHIFDLHKNIVKYTHFLWKHFLSSYFKAQKIVGDVKGVEEREGGKQLSDHWNGR